MRCAEERDFDLILTEAERKRALRPAVKVREESLPEHSDVRRYPSGKPKSAWLSRNATVQGVRCWGSSWVTFYENGQLKSATLRGDQDVNGVTCADNSEVYFYESGSLRSVWLAGDQTINGVPYLRRQPVDFHENGGVQSGILAVDAKIGGIPFEKGDKIEFTPEGRIGSDLAANWQRKVELADSYFEGAQRRILTGELDVALRRLDDALRYRPDHAEALALRGRIRIERGEFQKAVEDLSRALQIDQQHMKAVCTLAWLLATCRDDTIRDGGRAMELAQIAFAANPSAENHDNLAAAYAETGKFEQAVEIQQKAIEILIKAGPEKYQIPFQKRLQRYKNKRAWRD